MAGVTFFCLEGKKKATEGNDMAIVFGEKYGRKEKPFRRF